MNRSAKSATEIANVLSIELPLCDENEGERLRSSADQMLSRQTVRRNSRSQDEQWKIWTSVSGPRGSVPARGISRPHAHSGNSVEPGSRRRSNIVALEFTWLSRRATAEKGSLQRE